jgi:hypothetical protein
MINAEIIITTSMCTACACYFIAGAAYILNKQAYIGMTMLFYAGSIIMIYMGSTK